MKKILITTFFLSLSIFFVGSVAHAQSATGNPVGDVESASCSTVSGWSYDPTYAPAPVYGCTNPAATNYKPSATADDGSCVLPPSNPTNPTACISRYRWVNISAGTINPALGCANAGATAIASSPLGICASGEDRPSSGHGYASINYSKGTWGAGGYGGDFVRYSSKDNAYRCYSNANNQNRDEDVTDIAVAYYCDFGSQYAASCPDDTPTPPSGGGCFTSVTPIAMADGSVKDVSELMPGDSVRGETSINHVIEVVHVLLGNRSLYSIDGREAFVTSGHPFKTTDGWKSIDPAETVKEGVDIPVKQLAFGDHILTEMGTETVVSIVPTKANPLMTLYNPVLDGDHTYYANGLLVHNKKAIIDNEDTTRPSLNLAPGSFFDDLVALFKPLIALAASSDSNSVNIYEGATLLATVPANISRPDVDAVLNISGNHGFSWTVPTSLINSAPHTLHFYGTNTDSHGSVTELSNSPQTLQCAPAAKPNSAPSKPSIICPSNSSSTNVPLTVSFTASDPDGNNVRYDIDWDNNGSVDQIVPSGGTYVASGVQQSAMRSWSTAGTETVSVKAQDDQGAFSPSTSCSFTVVDPPGSFCKTHPSDPSCATPTTCTDSAATNVGGSLPCTYPPGSPQFCALYPSDPSCATGSGGGGGGSGSGGGSGGGGNGGGQTAFTVTANPSTVNLRVLGNIQGGTSDPSIINVNPGPGFADAYVNLSVSSPDLPANTVYSFDNSGSSMKLNSCFTGDYCSAATGLIGSKLTTTVSTALPNGTQYHIIITATPSDGSSPQTTTIILVPNGINPTFKEI